MKEQDEKRFVRYLIKAFKTEYMRAQYLLKGGETSLAHTIVYNERDETNTPRYMLDDDIHSLTPAEGKTFHILLSLFTKHFVESDNIEVRVKHFLINVIHYLSENNMNSDQFGWWYV